MTTERLGRVYRPWGEGTPSAAKAGIAAARPRDARGHFLPSAGGRDRAAVVPVVLAELVGDTAPFLADLAAQSSCTTSDQRGVRGGA